MPPAAADMLDPPMIVVPPPAEALGPPPVPEAAGLAALFDDIPRSDPSMPIPRPVPPTGDTPAFDLDVHVGALSAGGDDPTIDLPHAQMEQMHADMGQMEEPQPEAAQPLGAALVAAFEHNRTAPVDVGQVVEIAAADTPFSMDTEQSTMSMPSPIVVRLRDLQQRLAAEGRTTDAEILVQALALLESGGA